MNEMPLQLLRHSLVELVGKVFMKSLWHGLNRQLKRFGEKGSEPDNGWPSLGEGDKTKQPTFIRLRVEHCLSLFVCHCQNITSEFQEFAVQKMLCRNPRRSDTRGDQD